MDLPIDKNKEVSDSPILQNIWGAGGGFLMSKIGVVISWDVTIVTLFNKTDSSRQ